MRIEAPGAAGLVVPTDNARPLAVRVAQAGDPAKASDAFVLPSPDKIVKLQPTPLGGGLEASAYRLPEGATFDTVKLVTIDGKQVLALVQADGSILVLEGVGPASGSAVPGAAEEVSLPNLLIGNVEVPREALAAAFQANGIQPAAGGEPIVSSGNNFGDPVPDIGPGGRFGPLLPPTELSQDRLERPDFGGDLGNRNGGLAGLTGGTLSASLTGSSPLAPSFIAGTFTGTPAGGSGGSGTGGAAGIGGGTTEPGTGTGTGTGNGTGNGGGLGARSGLAIVDQSATDLGTNPASNAEFKTLAIDVSAGTAAATVSFNAASLAGLVTNTNGVGGPDVTWKLVNPNLIAGYVNVPGAGGPEERLVITVELRGQPGVATNDPIVIPKDTTGPVYVVVHVIDGIPDAAGDQVNGLDLGQIVLHATSSVGTADGVIAIQVLDDAPKAGFEVVTGNAGGSAFGIVHDETAGTQATADDRDGTPPALLSGVPGIASPLIGWAEKALGSQIVDTSKIGADHYPTDINGDLTVHYALTNGAGKPFAGTDTLLTATNGGAHIFLYSETVAGQAVLVGREGTAGIADATGKVAFVLYLDGASNLSLAQYEAIAHPVPGNNNETVSTLANLVHLTQSLTDGDGDTASFTSPIGLGISFTDDGPAPVGIALSGATLVLDETRVATAGDANALVDEPGANPFPPGLGQPIGIVTGTAPDVLGNPAANFGADGPASKNALVFSLVTGDHKAFSTTDGVATGLSVTHTNTGGSDPAIFLYAVPGSANLLVGKTGDGTIAFAIRIDPQDGSVSVAQYAAIHHGDPANPDDAALLGNGNDLVFVAMTATDGDGDSATVYSASGLHVAFEDDGPKPFEVTLSKGAIVLDETTVSTPGDGNALDDTPGTNPFPAAYGQPIGVTSGVSAIVTLGAGQFGSDGPAATQATVFKLVQASGADFSNPAGVATQLAVTTPATDPNSDPAIRLYADPAHAGVVLGKSADGTIAFAITVDPQTGAVTVAQYAAIHHGDAGNPDDSASLTDLSGGGLIHVAVTLTDGDGDSLTSVSQQGVQIAFEDDAPRLADGAKPVVIGVDESGLDTAFSHGNHDGEPDLRDGETKGNDAVKVTGSLAGLVDVGADKFAHPGAEYSVKLAAVLPDVFSQGEKVAFSVDQLTGTITGTANGHTVLSLTVAANGNYSFTIFDQIDHPAGDNAEGSLSLDLSGFIVAKDADGDGLTLPGGSVVLKVQDDIPVLVHGGGPDGWTVNEHGVETHDGSATVTGSLQPLVSVGADEVVFAGKDGGSDILGSRFSLSLGDRTAETDQTVHGCKVLVRQEGNTLVGFVEGSGGPGHETKAFVFTLNDNGSFSFELLTKLDHTDGHGSNDVDLSGFIRAEDFDHDGIGLAPGMVAFHVTDGVTDDVPTTTGNTFVGNVDESALPGGNPDPGMGSTAISGSLQGLVNPGANAQDGHALFSIEPGANGLVMPGITSGHGDVTLHVVGNSQLIGVGEGRDVFRLDLNADGTFTFHLLGPIDHRDEHGGSAQDVLPVDLSPYIHVQDTDGDAVALNPGSFVVNVKDDMPVSVPCEIFEVTASVYEVGLAGAGPDTPTTAGSHDGFGTAPTLLGLFKAGADGALEVGLKAKFNDGDLPRLYSNGVLLTYSLSADTGQLTAKAGNQTIFTLTVAKDGDWSFVLEGHLDHVPGKGDDAELFTDSGYPVSGLDLSRFVVGIDNDSDTLVGATPGSFLIRIVDDVPHFVTAEADAVANKAGSTGSGDVQFDVGADAPGSATLFAPVSGTTEQTVGGAAVKTVLSSDGKTITGYVDIDSNTNTVSPNEKVFTVSLNGDTYSYTQIKAFDGMLQPAASVTGSTAFGSGQPTSQILTTGDGTAIAILTGYVVTTSGNHPFDQSAWLAGNGATAGLEQRNVQGSTSGWGVNNDNFNAQEFIRVDFHDQDFGAPQGFAGPVVTSASFEFANFSNSGNNADVVKFVAYYEDGTTASGQVPASTITIGDGSRPLDYIEFYQAAGQTKLDLVGIGRMSMAPANAGLEFDVVKSDSDGDNASGTISITVSGDKIQEASSDCDTHLVASSDKNTVLVGHGGDDFLTGGKGDDILIGNLGSDTLAGGGGRDTFKLTDIAAHDLITDYKVGEDKIDLTGLFSAAIGGPSSAVQLAEYVSYDKATGELKVDTDGHGSAAAPVLVAVVDSTPSSHPASITIVYDDHSHAHQQANVTG